MIGLGSDKNCVSQTFHRKPIKFCCELGFIWCKGRLWWTGKVKVQLCLSWKKDESATAPIRKKLKVHEQIVQGSCHLHVFLPLCTWRGKERQSLHFTWHFIFYLSISPDCLTYTLAVLILFLVDWIRAPTRSIPAQVAVGEELTWSYTNVLQPQAATLSKHLDTWMFKCTCPRWKTWSTEALLTKKKLTKSIFKAKKWKTYRILTLTSDKRTTRNDIQIPQKKA